MSDITRTENIRIVGDLAAAKGDMIAADADANFARVPAGTDGQVLTADSAEDKGVKWATLAITKAAVGLANADNTSDADKPVSTATQTALDKKLNSTVIITSGTCGPSLTRYNAPGVSGLTQDTIAKGSVAWPGSGFFSDLQIYIVGNAGIATYTITLYVNGSATAITKNCDINTATGELFTDLVHTTIVTKGQLVAWEVVTGANGGFSPLSVNWSVKFTEDEA